MAIRRRRKIAITHPGAVVVCQSLVVSDKRREAPPPSTIINDKNNINKHENKWQSEEEKIAITHPGAVIVCQSLVVNDKRGEKTEEEGAQQFATHHLQQIFKTLYMKKKIDIL